MSTELTVVVIGGPGKGKSSFLTSIFNAPPQSDEIDAYEVERFEVGHGFKSKTIVPSVSDLVFPYQDQHAGFKVRLIDLPGIGGVDNVQPSSEWTDILSEKPIDAVFVVMKLSVRENISDYISRSFVAYALKDITAKQVFLLYNGFDDIYNGAITGRRGRAAEIVLDEMVEEHTQGQNGCLTLFQGLDSSLQEVPQEQIIKYSSTPQHFKHFIPNVMRALHRVAETKVSGGLGSIRLDAAPEVMEQVFSDPNVRSAINQTNPQLQKDLDAIMAAQKKAEERYEREVRPITPGRYKIYCYTQSKGLRYLEAWPQDGFVRPSVESDSQDQIWHLSIYAGDYIFSCKTANCGEKNMEAFPKTDEVKPRDPNKSDRDQRWKIRRFDGGFKISCDTQNCGTRYLEAFPKHDKARTKPQSNDPDQIWHFDLV